MSPTSKFAALVVLALSGSSSAKPFAFWAARDVNTCTFCVQDCAVATTSYLTLTSTPVLTLTITETLTNTETQSNGGGGVVTVVTTIQPVITETETPAQPSQTGTKIIVAPTGPPTAPVTSTESGAVITGVNQMTTCLTQTRKVFQFFIFN